MEILLYWTAAVLVTQISSIFYWRSRLRVLLERNVELSLKHGEVIDSKTWSETRISQHTQSGGASGHVHPQYGGTINVAPTTTTTTSSQTKVDQVFVNFARGGERSYTFRGIRVSFRKGSKISCVFAAPEENATILAIRNVQTDELDTHHAGVSGLLWGSRAIAAAGPVGLIVYWLPAVAWTLYVPPLSDSERIFNDLNNIDPYANWGISVFVSLLGFFALFLFIVLARMKLLDSFWFSLVRSKCNGLLSSV